VRRCLVPLSPGNIGNDVGATFLFTVGLFLVRDTSEATVKTHVNHIFSKTGLRDRTQLVGYVFRNGLAFPR
jgi:hypothetical protein